jgi:hypothetical protein
MYQKKTMKKDDHEFRERISRDSETRRAACKVLGVEENAGREALKKAYRRASMEYHPDHNLNDVNAHKKFLMVKCAYKLLAEDEPCEMLLKEIESWPCTPDDDKYKLDNLWGHFLWWREKFF